MINSIKKNKAGEGVGSDRCQGRTSCNDGIFAHRDTENGTENGRAQQVSIWGKRIQRAKSPEEVCLGTLKGSGDQKGWGAV